jgi:hypothetical protein
MSKGVCEKLGCCWAPGIYGIDHEDVPPCFRYTTIMLLCSETCRVHARQEFCLPEVCTT